ncbi:coiled-coil domain-containing protein 122 isoform X2 [Lepisosteus oculatus]|uniref:coiled-coil domain-containing protein 122 isoform X2 n=1 Tax=Lepisosteus oculatus TaxID=7918 RepID=UPI0035F50755
MTTKNSEYKQDQKQIKSLEELPGSPLKDAVEKVSQHEEKQTNEINEHRKFLALFKIQVSELEVKSESVSLELHTAEMENLRLVHEMAALQKQSECEKAQSRALYKENVELRLQIEQEEENFQLLLAGYNTYRNKMAAHRDVVSRREGRAAAQKKRCEKADSVRKLKVKMEELRTDLQRPDGTVIRQAQIENRRCEAILKRLHCQLKKAQSDKRQMNADILQMKKKAEDLRKCLPATD